MNSLPPNVLTTAIGKSERKERFQAGRERKKQKKATKQNKKKIRGRTDGWNYHELLHPPTI
jgi:hypothetical protein